MPERYLQVEESVSRLAASTFERHAVEAKGPNEWRFARAGTAMHSAHIIVRPRVVIVYGDVGDWILSHSDPDSLAWLRGAVANRGYLLGKIVAGSKEQFYPGDAMEAVAPGESDDAEEAAMHARVNECLREGMWGAEPSEYEWARAWMEAGSDGDYPRCVGSTASALWLHALLAEFVRRLSA